MFINYAHRGASEYEPENTLSAFYAGVAMGANGIETDIQRTKDGILVLFHDDTLKRVTGADGGIGDYTYEELLRFTVHNKACDRFDKIPTLESFLTYFGWRDLTFAIDLKMDGVAEQTRLTRTVSGPPKPMIPAIGWAICSQKKRKTLSASCGTWAARRSALKHTP